MPESNKETEGMPCVKDPPPLTKFRVPCVGKYVPLSLDYEVTREPTDGGGNHIDGQPQASKIELGTEVSIHYQ